ncbi:hypothetical protein D1818_00210 [Aquimarina sp. BL5]|nr:hypothetical protein D1818_00210 [Aquimarina sp. BL5]RKM92456.1 hypothetical protein D7036_22760 [Aquimarina sp. BL5]
MFKKNCLLFWRKLSKTKSFITEKSAPNKLRTDFSNLLKPSYLVKSIPKPNLCLSPRIQAKVKKTAQMSGFLYSYKLVIN